MKKTIFILSILIVFSCNIEPNEPPLTEPMDINAWFTFENIEFNKHDSIYIDIKVNTDHPNLEHSIIWLHPANFTSDSAIQFSFKDKLRLECKLVYKDREISLAQTIISDTILSNKIYDYRNKFIGQYNLNGIVEDIDYSFTGINCDFWDSIYHTCSHYDTIQNTAIVALHKTDKLSIDFFITYDTILYPDERREFSLYPTASFNGKLTYPELDEKYAYASFEGSISVDSLYVFQHMRTKWFERKISFGGTKASD